MNKGMKGREYLEQQRVCHLPKQNSVSWSQFILKAKLVTRLTTQDTKPTSTPEGKIRVLQKAS
jgi:hypothetical protein